MVCRELIQLVLSSQHAASTCRVIVQRVLRPINRSRMLQPQSAAARDPSTAGEQAVGRLSRTSAWDRAVSTVSILWALFGAATVDGGTKKKCDAF